MRTPAAAALLLCATLAAAASFDGGRTGRLPSKADAEEAPQLRGSRITAPEAVPDDIIAAGKRWSLGAQAALLDGGAAGEPFSFAVIGDAEPGRFAWERIWSPGKNAYRDQLRAIQAQSPDFIIQLGDFVSKGTVKDYRAYLAFLPTEVSAPIFHLVGNHDRSTPNGDADKTLYHAVFGPGDFFFDHKGWRFVLLDSADSRVTGAQLDWLDRVLDTPLQTVVFTHVVPGYLRKKLSSPDPGGIVQSIDPSDEPIADAIITGGFFDEGAERFGKIVSARKVRRVYMGHIHAFGTADYEGVRYVLTAGGGSPLYPLPPGYPSRRKAHYIKVQAGAGTYVATVRELDGTSFTLP